MGDTRIITDIIVTKLANGDELFDVFVGNSVIRRGAATDIKYNDAMKLEVRGSININPPYILYKNRMLIENYQLILGMTGNTVAEFDALLERLS
jgi:hypothetical protein